MKRTFSLLAALMLATALTACANTATGPDMAPGYDNTYGSYGNTYGYGSSGNYANGYTTPRNNVSTTPSGRVNGKNRTTTGRTTTANRHATGSARTTTNTNAMGAGMRG